MQDQHENILLHGVHLLLERITTFTTGPWLSISIELYVKSRNRASTSLLSSIQSQRSNESYSIDQLPRQFSRAGNCICKGSDGQHQSHMYTSMHLSPVQAYAYVLDKHVDSLYKSLLYHLCVYHTCIHASDIIKPDPTLQPSTQTGLPFKQGW